MDILSLRQNDLTFPDMLVRTDGLERFSHVIHKITAESNVFENLKTSPLVAHRSSCVAGHWSLIAVRCSLFAVRWLLVAGRCSLFALRRSLFGVRCPLFVVLCFAGCWSLVAGRWSLVAPLFRMHAWPGVRGVVCLEPGTEAGELREDDTAAVL